LIALNRRDASNEACNSLQTALELNPSLPGARPMLLHELRRRDVLPRAVHGRHSGSASDSSSRSGEGIRSGDGSRGDSSSNDSSSSSSSSSDHDGDDESDDDSDNISDDGSDSTSDTSHSESAHAPHNEAERRGGTEVPVPRYELDDSAVVTLGDRAALSCRRARQFVRQNWLEWCILYSLLYFLMWLGGALHWAVGSGIRAVTEHAATCQQRHDARIEYLNYLKEYPKQYEAFQRSRTRDRDDSGPSPSLHASDSSCAASPPSVSPPWSWITDADTSSANNDQCPRMKSTPRHA
jgi:hypothetical protein